MIAASPGVNGGVIAAQPVARPVWTEVLSHVDPRYGGLSAAVPALTAAIEAEGRYATRVAAFCLPEEQRVPDRMGAERISFWPVSRMVWLRDRGLRTRWEALVAASDGVHIHGLWEQSSASAAAAARREGKPYVVSAHGMLEPWALRNKRWKKRVYSALVERSVVQGAACLHALTRAEAVNYREYGAKGAIAIIPNGVRIPGEVSPEIFLAAHPQLRGKRLVLFLGRLHPKKGVDLLVDAWGELAGSWPEAHLVLAGPDEDGTRAKLEEQIATRGLRESVSFTGMLSGAIKWSALAAASCFTLPSHSEGLSMGVLEAMGMGLPVLVTEGCHMPEVLETGAGWQTRPMAGELATALGTFLCNSDGVNRAMGERGRRLVEERYSWESVGARMADLYSWLLGAPRPESLEVVLP